MNKVIQKRIAIAAVVTAIVTTVMLVSQPAIDSAIQRFSDSAVSVVPLKQVAIYREQAVSYSNFNAAIFAQGQLADVGKFPTGAEIVLYIDANRINGAGGLQSGARCAAAQSAANYNQDTITMDRRFCPDFNDAILDGVVYSTIAPTEAVFLHKQNGERCYITNGAAAEYFINPADYYYRDYLARRIAEKLEQHKLGAVFLDDLRPGWAGITASCGGTPKEYATSTAYYSALRELARFVYDNVAADVYGNLARAGAHWQEFAFLDGAMCESCFTNWGSEVSASQLLTDLQNVAAWDKKLFIVPMTNANEKFYFVLSLLAADEGDYYHFGDNTVYNPLPEYSMNIGKPIADYSCIGNVCSRRFERATVTVDLAARTGSISKVTQTSTPTAAWECFEVTAGRVCFQQR